MLVVGICPLLSLSSLTIEESCSNQSFLTEEGNRVADVVGLAYVLFVSLIFIVRY